MFVISNVLPVVFPCVWSLANPCVSNSTHVLSSSPVFSVSVMSLSCLLIRIYFWIFSHCALQAKGTVPLLSLTKSHLKTIQIFQQKKGITKKIVDRNILHKSTCLYKLLKENVLYFRNWWLVSIQYCTFSILSYSKLKWHCSSRSFH